MQMNFSIDGNQLRSDIAKCSNETIEVLINGQKQHFSVVKLSNNQYEIISKNSKSNITYLYNNSTNTYSFYLEGNMYKVERTVSDSTEIASQPNDKEVKIKAPIPGLIVNMHVKQGDHVKTNQLLLVLDAMKMHNEIASPINGTVQKIYVKQGEQVEKNKLMFEISNS